MAFKDIGKRLLVAAAGGPLILAAAWFGGLFFFTLVVALVVFSTVEFIALLKNKNSEPSAFLLIAAAVALCLIAYLRYFFLFIPLTTVLLVLLFAIEITRPSNNSIRNVSGALFAYLYIGGLLSFMIALRELPLQLQLDYRVGGEWLVLLLLAIWICDSAAYFVGSRFGKRKLAPNVSPNKTIEGALGGVAGGVLTVWGCQLTFASSLSTVDVLVIGLIVGIFGQASDLIESLLKRDAGVKDTSTLLPGHGGVLDRFDSEMLVMPAVYFYFLL